MTKWWARIAASCLIATTAILWISASSAQTLRIGLAEDPDILDPTLARTYVGRIVFAALCDKLVDIGPELEIVPQLATEWQWTDNSKGLVVKLRPGVKFQDGEPLDATAVKFNIEAWAQRLAHYRNVAEHTLKDLPIIYLYHGKLLYAAAANLSGFTPYPDGLIRLQGLRME